MKAKFIIALLCCTLCLTGCFKTTNDLPPSPFTEQDNSTVPTVDSIPIGTMPQVIPHQESSSPIPIAFRHIYSGFTGVGIDDSEKKAEFGGFGTRLIVTEDAWSSFMGTYCPGIPYSESWDFSSECLLVSITMGSRPTYANSNTITGLSWYESYFVFEFENDPANYIYALNDETTTHYYVEVIAISRADLPAGADAYFYRPEES